MDDRSPTFAEPRSPAFEDCYFYHSMDIPNHGEVRGDFDLRGRESDYLGHVDLAGKTVLEIGTASGHLCFWMERQGARMVAYDLSEKHEWDIVPYSRLDFTEYVRERKAHVRSINDSWWFAHRRFDSKARVVYGSVYELPDTLRSFDVVTMGAILLHLRDPFRAIEKAAAATDDVIVITELAPPARDRALASLWKGRFVRFLPDAATAEPWETWWQLSPEFIVEVLKILGFAKTTIANHRQRYRGKEVELFTVVGSKRSSMAARESAREPAADGYALHDKILRAIPARHLLRHLAGRIRRRLRSDS